MKRIVIAGGGILGLSIGISLRKNNPKIEVIIYEKENSHGLHASGRNSGVLHAGFYYSPESLKAKFCREGNNELRKIIKKYNLPIKEIGKVVIAQNENELIGLEKLYTRGLANGVEIEMRPVKDLEKVEPLARSEFDFLWSPTTAVSDPVAVSAGLAREFVSLGGLLKTNSKATVKNGKLTVNGIKVDYDHLVNSAGGQATSIAKTMGFASEYRTMPFLGTYKQVVQRELPIRTLIYPVPHPINPFLGVHLTLTIDGMVKIGPTAIPIIGNEQYEFLSPVTTKEFLDYFRNIYGVAKSEKHDIKSIAIAEFPNLITSVSIGKAAKLVPLASSVTGWSKKKPGIRSQLINSKSGELVQDFVVEGDSMSTHVLNAVSPGWTAAIPFGEFIAKKVLGIS